MNGTRRHMSWNCHCRALLLSTAVLLLCRPSNGWAGFEFGKDTDADNFRGKPLTALPAGTSETDAVKCAIQKIRDLANAAGEPAYNKRILERIADCLADMLKNGRICREEGGTGSNGSRWFAKGENEKMKCTWDEDAINVKPRYLKKTEPAISELTSLLVHESIHAIQWPDGSGLADDTNQMEWVAYSWGYYIDCKLLENPNLTQAEREAIQNRKDGNKKQRDAYCSLVPQSSLDKASKEAQSSKPSKSDPTKRYQQSGIDSSFYRVADEFGLLYQIPTGADRTYAFEVWQDDLGRDLLIVAAIVGNSGRILVFSDNTGDGLADAGTGVVVAFIPEPIDIALTLQGLGCGGHVVVLDGLSGNLYLILANAQCRPSNLLPTPFVDAAFFPDIVGKVTIRDNGSSPVTGMSIIASLLNEQMDLLSSEPILHVFSDTNLDFVADEVQVSTWEENSVGFAPFIMGGAQHGDLTLPVAGMANTSLELRLTDENVTFLGEMIGQRFILVNEHGAQVTMNLLRPLAAGEYVVLVDVTNLKHASAGHLVNPVRPEILSTDKGRYLSGETITVFGRHFTLGSTVTVSGQPVPAAVVSNGIIQLTAPLIYALPASLFVLEVLDGTQVSNIAGVDIRPDCNLNGLEDRIEIADDPALDGNANGILDVCEIVNPPAVAPAPHNRRKNRYISFTPNNGANPVAFRVQRTTAPAGSCWVQAPVTAGNDINTATCGANPVFRVWNEPVLHVGDCEIIPVADYMVFANSAGPIENPVGLAVSTILVPNINGKLWADSVGSFNGVEWTPPNQIGNVNDVLDILARIAGAAGRPEFPVANLSSTSSSDSCLSPQVNAADVLAAVQAVAGASYGPPSSVRFTTFAQCAVPPSGACPCCGN